MVQDYLLSPRPPRDPSLVQLVVINSSSSISVEIIKEGVDLLPWRLVAERGDALRKLVSIDLARSVLVPLFEDVKDFEIIFAVEI